MKKLNNRFTQVLFLGAALGASFGIAPAQAQGGFGTDGARQVLDRCPEKLPYLQKCDPNADVVTPAPANAGLEGSVNFTPLINPGGFILQGTGQTDANGEPLVNIDFVPPQGQGYGKMYTVNAPATSDFRPYLGWAGKIKDLRTTGTNGVPFPSPTNPRIRDFIRVDQDSPDGDGVVDGVQTGGFAADLVYVAPVDISAVGVGSSLSYGWEMQVYKLDTSGKRIEEQNRVPIDPNLPPISTTVFANTFVGAVSASFSDLTEAELKSAIDGDREVLSGYGYSINMTSTPDNRIIPQGEIPEPTTILSSLLLFGGGAFKLRNRKRA